MSNKPDLSTTEAVQAWVVNAVEVREDDVLFGLPGQQESDTETAARIARAMRLLEFVEGVGADMDDWAVDDFGGNVSDMLDVLKQGDSDG